MENNSALTFNKDDSLMLTCVGQMSAYNNFLYFAFTKGNKAPSNMTITYPDSFYQFNIEDPGTLVYDDLNGPQPGFENVAIHNYNSAGSYLTAREVRFMSISSLKSNDAGTYHCSALLSPYTDYGSMLTSGALIINVNTKPGQALSTRAGTNQFLTYSAIMIGTTKLYL